MIKYLVFMFLVIWKSACFFSLYTYWVVNVWCCSEKRLERCHSVSPAVEVPVSSCGGVAVNAPRPVSVCTEQRFRFSLNFSELVFCLLSDDPCSLLSVLPCFNCQTKTTCLSNKIFSCDVDCESSGRHAHTPIRHNIEVADSSLQPSRGT